MASTIVTSGSRAKERIKKGDGGNYRDLIASVPFFAVRRKRMRKCTLTLGFLHHYLRDNGTFMKR